jgi:hypothetical protein
MSIYLMGSEPDIATGNFVVNTSVDYHDPLTVRCSMGVWNGETLVLTLPAEVGADSTAGWWFHGRGMCGYDIDTTDFNQTAWFTARDSDGVDVVKCSTVASGVITFSVYGADGGTTAADPWDSAFGYYVSKVIDVHVYKSGSDTRLDVYANSALVATATVVGETNPGVAQILLGGPYNGYTLDDDARFHWSEFIVANEDTRFYRVGIWVPTGLGTHTAGTGTFADIDEIGTDANAVLLGSVGDRESWTVTMAGTHPLGGIRAVAINGLVASDGTNDLQASIRIGSADYDSADLGVTLAPMATSVIWDENPATTAPWGTLDLTTLEYGYQAVA